jgi:hypothetical protein
LSLEAILYKMQIFKYSRVVLGRSSR